jgi:nitronate monooxygenase
VTRTRLTELVDCEWPVQLAAMGGGVGGADLALAVQAAGGLGMVAWDGELPDPRCGVNFLVPFLPPIDVVEGVSRHVGVVEFFFGDPDAVLVDVAHGQRALVGWQVGSGDEASAAVAAGCDFVVVQGVEAGGHVRGQMPLNELLTSARGRVDVPVVAAGGIATPERVEELVSLGADGVRVGTAFLACPESRAHEAYVRALLAASGDDTVLTGWFDERWPNAPHRVLAPALAAAQRSGWRDSRPPRRGETRSVADMAQYAGMGVGHVSVVRPAREVLATLVSGLS